MDLSSTLFPYYFLFFSSCATLLTELLIVPQVKELSALQKELLETKQALANANQEKDKLFQELRKYNPFFEL